MLASQLITNAYYLSGIVGEQFETPTVTQSVRGLELLNEVLSSFFANLNYLIYRETIDFSFAINVEKYSLPNVAQIETLTYFLGPTTRMPLKYVGRDEYFESARVSMSGLPLIYHTERSYGGLDVYVYPFPSSGYAAQAIGQEGALPVIFSTEISDTYDGFFLQVLKYQLACLLLHNYQMDIPVHVAQKVKELRGRLREIAMPDLTLKSTGALSNQSNFLRDPTLLNFVPRG